MTQLKSIVDSLESKLQKLIAAHNALQKDHKLLKEAFEKLEQLNQNQANELNQLRETSQELKMANAMLGSDQHKRETKLKINALVRDIEQCIAHIAP
jgi:peptidoglycan hydrolase CwlO-like protein